MLFVLFILATDSSSPSAQYRFDVLDLTVYENVITDQIPETIDEVNPILLAIKTWLADSQEILCDNVAESARHTYILTESYAGMVFYPMDRSDKFKMLKTLIDLLEDLLGRLDQDLHMFFCLDSWYKLGLALFNMFELKYDDLMLSATPKKPEREAVFALFDKSVAQYKHFISNSDNSDSEERLILANIACASMSAKMADLVGPDEKKKYIVSRLVHITTCNV